MIQELYESKPTKKKVSPSKHDEEEEE